MFLSMSRNPLRYGPPGSSLSFPPWELLPKTQAAPLSPVGYRCYTHSYLPFSVGWTHLIPFIQVSSYVARATSFRNLLSSSYIRISTGRVDRRGHGNRYRPIWRACGWRG